MEINSKVDDRDSLSKAGSEKSSSNLTSQKLPLRTKFAFAAGDVPGAIVTTVVGFYAQSFLLETALIKASYVSFILLFAKVWDGICDPIVGFLVSKTRLKWGRLRAWTFFALPVCLAGYFCFWQVPDISPTAKVAYYFFMIVIYQTGYASYQVPYTSLTMHLSNEPIERDSATTMRMAFDVITVVFGAVVQGTLLVDYATAGTQCPYCVHNINNSTVAVYNEGAIEGYRVASLIMIAVAVVGGYTCFFGVKEDMSERPSHLSFIQDFKLVIKSKTYLILLGLFLWVWMSNAVIQTNVFLYVKYVVRHQTDFNYLLATNLIACFCAMPVNFALMEAIGKRNTYLINLLILIPSMVVNYFMPQDVDVGYLYLANVIGGLGLSGAYLLPWAMLPDVIDEIEVLTNERNESVFYAYFVFFQKLASGLAIGLSSLALDFAHYNNSQCCDLNGLPVQPPAVVHALRLLIGVGAPALSTLAFIFVWLYPLTAEKSLQNKQTLIKKRQEEAKQHRGSVESMPLLLDRSQRSEENLGFRESSA